MKVICSKCSAEIADESVICPQCGNHVAAAAHKEKLDEARSYVPKTVEGVLHSNLFLIFAIFLSVATFGSMIAFFRSLWPWTSFVSALFSTAPVLACGIVATVGAWMLFANRKTTDPKKLNMIKALMTVYHVLSIIALVLFAMVAALLFVVVISVAMGGSTGIISDINYMLRDMGVGYSIPTDIVRGFDQGGMFFLLLIPMVAGAAITASVFSIRVYNHSGKYWKTLSNTLATGLYQPGQVPTILLCVWGGIIGFCTIIMSLVNRDFVTFLIGSGMAGVLFMQGMMFRKIHETEIKVFHAIREEEAAFNTLEREALQAEVKAQTETAEAPAATENV